jgi:hypothetical protein
MVVSSIAVPPDPERDARALELVDSVGSWPLFVLKQPYGGFPAGTVFRRAPSSKGGGTTYLVNAVACRCPDYQEWGHICKHVRAVVRWEQRQAVTTAALASGKSYADLCPACKGGCGDVADRATATATAAPPIASGRPGRPSVASSSPEEQESKKQPAGTEARRPPAHPRDRPGAPRG